ISFSDGGRDASLIGLDIHIELLEGTSDGGKPHVPHRERDIAMARVQLPDHVSTLLSGFRSNTAPSGRLTGFLERILSYSTMSSEAANQVLCYPTRMEDEPFCPVHAS